MYLDLETTSSCSLVQKSTAENSLSLWKQFLFEVACIHVALCIFGVTVAVNP